ncbi:MAG: CDP-diacylglycerol--glycerol-3-phosphate 3-phosphatidyltransferase [candidate division Zixibacteria bacterium]|nr:CDP-diacylglycerol--glycerol-3-phosphate 3-phosphatidyltransferase [candidate division Zixibacteria bacterium]
MNLPNVLTITRIILSPIFIFFFMLESFPMRVTGLAIFVIAALTDVADGHYARKRGVITGFGKFMDPLADKILVSSALVSFTSLDFVSPLPVMLIIAREFSITGLRLLVAYKGVIISPSPGAKFKTFMQMWSIILILVYFSLVSAFEFYGVSPSPLAGFDAKLYAHWILWITAIATVWTGLDYVIKYFSVIRSVLR